jgi:hypothetical protein
VIARLQERCTIFSYFLSKPGLPELVCHSALCTSPQLCLAVSTNPLAIFHSSSHRLLVSTKRTTAMSGEEEGTSLCSGAVRSYTRAQQLICFSSEVFLTKYMFEPPAGLSPFSPCCERPIRAPPSTLSSSKASTRPLQGTDQLTAKWPGG